jgi:hypothetical protein
MIELKFPEKKRPEKLDLPTYINIKISILCSDENYLNYFSNLLI